MSQWVDRPPTSPNRLNTKKAIACASFWKYLVGIVYIFMHHYWLHFLYRQITYAPNRRLPVHRGWPMHIITKVTGLPSVFWDRLRKVNRPMSGDYTSVKEVVILHLLVCLWTWQLHESSTNFDEVFGVVSCVTCQQHSLVVNGDADTRIFTITVQGNYSCTNSAGNSRNCRRIRMTF